MRFLKKRTGNSQPRLTGTRLFYRLSCRSGRACLQHRQYRRRRSRPQVLFGITPQTGAIISAAIAVLIFVIKEAGKAMDRFTLIAGFVMILLVVYVAITTGPPVGEAVTKTIMPDNIDILAIVTLVGGTVGGYITFAGGHRLLDAGVKGRAAIPEVTKSSVSGI